MGRLSKTEIARQWEHITFQPMRGVNERTRADLEKALRYQKGISGKAALEGLRRRR